MRGGLLRFFRVFHALKCTGQENIPSGTVLFAANHLSYYDPFIIGATTDGLVAFMAWEALFSDGLIGRTMRNWGAFPVDPDGKDPGGFRRCLEILDDEKSVCVFPEGGRSFDGNLMPLRAGIARLAMRTGVPIVPVRLTGAHNAWIRGDLAPRPWFKIGVHFGEPIEPRKVKPGAERHAETKRIMDELERALSPPSDNGA